MRKHAPRKWLHAILDLLPCILIPVFMIYSHRHTLTQSSQLDIQYKYQSNEVNTISDLVVGNIYKYDDIYCDYTETDIFNSNISADFVVLGYSSFNISADVEYVDEEYLSSFDASNTFTYFSLGNTSCYIQYTSYDTFIAYSYEDNIQWSLDNFVFVYSGVQSQIDFISFYSSALNILPQYTDFNVIVSADLQDTNSSITDAFMNNFNGTVDRYFNFDSALPFTSDIYGWLNTNLFGGNIPPLATSIWHIIVYEFILDIMFIFYAFFMFLIDFTECLLEKPFDKGR